MWLQQRHHHRYIALFALALITIIVLIQPAQSTHATTKPKHGCASPIPPPVSGTLTQPPATAGILFLNEILLHPRTTWNCTELSKQTANAYDVWIELYNAQNQPLDLYGVHTSIDSGPNTNAFYLPFGSAIAAHSFLVIFPFNNPRFATTQGNTLRLLIAGIPIDTVTVPPLLPDQSYARVPDGGATWQITATPTIDASNGQAGTPPAGSGKAPTLSGNGGSGMNSGTPPAWSALSFPNTTTPVATAPSTLLPAPSLVFSSMTSMGTMDVAHKILLSLLVLGLVGTLFWCWRLFSSP